MIMKRTLILAASLTVCLSAALVAQHDSGSHSRHHGAGADHHIEMLAKRLDLNDSQKATLKQLFEDLRAELKPVSQEYRRLMEENRADLEDGNADAKTVGARTIAAQGLSRQMREAHDELLEKLIPILDADQKKELEEMREQHRKMGRYESPGF